MKLAALLMFITDIHALGLRVGAGPAAVRDLLLGPQRPHPRLLRPGAGRRPTASAPNHGACRLLCRGAALPEGGGRHRRGGGQGGGRRGGAADEGACRPTTTAFGPGRIREDGRKLHPAYLFEVKTPAESNGPWDYYKLAGTTPAEEAFRPLAEGDCPLVKG